MDDATTAPGVLFGSLLDRPVHARFDQPAASSDGGALLLKAVDERLGLTAALAGCLSDPRDPARVTHTTIDLLRQRLFLLAAGYEDCNDAARLIDDPMPRLLLDRDPVDGDDIASQPTLSRFENRIDARSLVRMGHALADVVIAAQRKRRRRAPVRRITIDMDPTDDQTHGQQQLSLFNAHYDGFCYLPVAAFIQFGDEPEQHLLGYVLRPGDAHASDGAIAMLERLIDKLRCAFPRAALRVRLDGGYATPEVFDYLDDAGVGYVVAIMGNSVLRDHAEVLMPTVRARTDETGMTEHDYAECQYGADSWGDFRRVVIKGRGGTPGRT